MLCKQLCKKLRIWVDICVYGNIIFGEPECEHTVKISDFCGEAEKWDPSQEGKEWGDLKM